MVFMLYIMVYDALWMFLLLLWWFNYDGYYDGLTSKSSPWKIYCASRTFVDEMAALHWYWFIFKLRPTYMLRRQNISNQNLPGELDSWSSPNMRMLVKHDGQRTWMNMRYGMASCFTSCKRPKSAYESTRTRSSRGKFTPTISVANDFTRGRLF